MRLNYSIRQNSINVPIIFAIITLIAFLPFTSMLFALKNDAFTGYFPPKFFMSESIHSGYFPLWNPYINYGIPQYGDMSSGFWSPVTWLFASTVGYNAYSFTLEEALYIFLAGSGMYYLTRHFNIDKRIGILAGVCYMCSGYIVGHLQHFNWVSGAAFLPWCIRAYLEIHHQIRWSSIFKFGVSFLLLVTSAHPGIVIGFMYFLLLLTIAIFVKYIRSRQPALLSLKKLTLSTLVILCVILIFCIGPIVGNLEILPHIGRGEKLTLSDSLGSPTTIQSWLSLLLPFSTTKDDGTFSTDIAMRNSYFGLLFLWLFISAVISKKTGWQKFLFSTLIFFFLLSLGGVFKNLAYTYLPFMGYVRLNGEFRIFTILSAILIAAIELNKQPKTISTGQKRIFYCIGVILVCIVIYALLHIKRTDALLFQTQQNVISRSTLKTLIANITFNDTLLFQATIQFAFLLWLFVLRKKGSVNSWLLPGIAEIIIATLLNLPFTGVGKASVKNVQEQLNKSPAGIPIPPVQPTVRNDSMPPQVTKLIGDWSLYSKQIGSIKEVPYPIRLNSTVTFFDRPDLQEINSKGFIYFSDPASKPTIKILSYSPNCISAEIYSGADQTCTVKQNYYPRWHCYINNFPTQINKTSTTFMSFSITRGTQKVMLKFQNSAIIFLTFWTILVFLVGIISIVIIHRKHFRQE